MKMANYISKAMDTLRQGVDIVWQKPPYTLLKVAILGGAVFAEGYIQSIGVTDPYIRLTPYVMSGFVNSKLKMLADMNREGRPLTNSELASAYTEGCLPAAAFGLFF